MIVYFGFLIWKRKKAPFRQIKNQQSEIINRQSNRWPGDVGGQGMGSRMIAGRLMDWRVRGRGKWGKCRVTRWISTRIGAPTFCRLSVQGHFVPRIHGRDRSQDKMSAIQQRAKCTRSLAGMSADRSGQTAAGLHPQRIAPIPPACPARTIPLMAGCAAP